MINNKDLFQSTVDKVNEKLENRNRIEQIITTTENYVRTERHLEQHSDIGDKQNIQHAKEIQKRRKEDIERLKNKIVYGENFNQNEYNNLVENYEATKEYLEHNIGKIDEYDYNCLLEKQKHREEKLKELIIY
ncbi:hypothetical protein [Clostridium sp. DL1XJH146]